VAIPMRSCCGVNLNVGFMRFLGSVPWPICPGPGDTSTLRARRGAVNDRSHTLHSDWEGKSAPRREKGWSRFELVLNRTATRGREMENLRWSQLESPGEGISSLPFTTLGPVNCDGRKGGGSWHWLVPVSGRGSWGRRPSLRKSRQPTHRAFENLPTSTDL